MANIRLIARLDVKGPNIVKGVHLEGLRKMGNPNEFAKKYYKQGIDEIIYVDIVASLYERNSLLDVVSRTTSDVFIPITVTGGIRSVDDVSMALRAGADKVAINTAAIKRPDLITEVAEVFGSQCMVLSVEAKNIGDNAWEAYYDNGREHSHKDVLEWVKQGEQLGAGEILLTSIDKEGTAKGVDIELIKAVSSVVSIPVIACGGVGNVDDIANAVLHGNVDAVAMAHVLHYDKLTVQAIRDQVNDMGINTRIAPGIC